MFGNYDIFFKKSVFGLFGFYNTKIEKSKELALIVVLH